MSPRSGGEQVAIIFAGGMGECLQADVVHLQPMPLGAQLLVSELETVTHTCLAWVVFSSFTGSSRHFSI